MIKIVEMAKIIQTVERLGGVKGGWASITQVRKVADLGDRFDALIIEMVLAGTVEIQPEDNQKMISLEDWAASVELGGRENHMIQIN